MNLKVRIIGSESPKEASENAHSVPALDGHTFLLSEKDPDLWSPVLADNPRSSSATKESASGPQQPRVSITIWAKE